ncbi:RelA/SpoT family protein [Ferroacidibacillus organovorans]|uniref:GTP pyrophosphokinase n=1 Tax=Ferroacidibacillus organovorans TaxID=1765683 RepID=A0A101XNR5_9BACL|nr:bifunctional (p)ppGpp synthetase/guanosine-3',5'-bis(diphosphate) 3'-pyrophosphohydrolase [Ferroacidibacillus organovorans]KUO94830.1 (p)ppGpp synthetase [Ferroacidibacillus organovorans]
MSSEIELEAADSSSPVTSLFEKAPYLNESERALLTRAYYYAALQHDGQKRSSGADYITHPLAVAEILADLHLDARTLAAALLHDVVEDTKVTDEELANQFGGEIRSLVDGVTKLKRLRFESREQQQAENLRKMFLAMAKDVRVALIRLADRLHNMRTLKYRPPEKQRKTAEETLEIFAPLAHRLGLSTIKWELEDISLRYLDPSYYYRIAHFMDKKREARETYVQKVIDDLRSKLAELSVHADLGGRAKHIYSIYRKMTELHKEFNEIYDLFAVRVIVDSVKDCYAVLGIVHTMWKPVPGRFKDYIAMPKANLYQSLHTTVIGPNGEPVEIQIRTWEMHRTAEYGIAAHWIYKEQGYAEKASDKGTERVSVEKVASDKGKDPTRVDPNDPSGSIAQKLAWFREMVEWQQDFRDAQEFMETLKVDLFSDEVFVFTPKGQVIELPAGSCPIDFAYRIHTDVGNRCVGAKVNGRIVTLDTRLRTGDIVEILTSKLSYGPSQDWLKIAQSSQARAKIRMWFKRERRDENVEKGRELLEREIAKHKLDPHTVIAAHLSEAMTKFNFSRPDDLFAAVGHGALSAAQIMTRILDRMRKEEEVIDSIGELPVTPLVADREREQKKRGQSKTPIGVHVRGIDNLLIRFSKCCNPVPGDEIVGFVTRGRGVSVHRTDCPNVLAMVEEGNRIIEVEWDNTAGQAYNVDIEVTALDRRGLINEVMNAVVETRTDITAVTGKADSRKMATIHLSIAIRNTEHLKAVVDRIKRVKDIYAVRRVIQ